MRQEFALLKDVLIVYLGKPEAVVVSSADVFQFVPSLTNVCVDAGKASLDFRVSEVW